MRSPASTRARSPLVSAYRTWFTVHPPLHARVELRERDPARVVSIHPLSQLARRRAYLAPLDPAVGRERPRMGATSRTRGAPCPWGGCRERIGGWLSRFPGRQHRRAVALPLRSQPVPRRRHGVAAGPALHRAPTEQLLHVPQSGLVDLFLEIGPQVASVLVQKISMAFVNRRFCVVVDHRTTSRFAFHRSHRPG